MKIEVRATTNPKCEPLSDSAQKRISQAIDKAIASAVPGVEIRGGTINKNKRSFTLYFSNEPLPTF